MNIVEKILYKIFDTSCKECKANDWKLYSISFFLGYRYICNNCGKGFRYLTNNTGPG